MFLTTDNNLGFTDVKMAPDSRDREIPSTNCTLEAVEVCLKCNHSAFKGNFFLQVCGTAMGPKNACNCADLAIGEINHKAKFYGSLKPALWWRYHDGIFDPWQQDLANLEKFAKYINSLYPTIKFELVCSESYLSVLDVTLHLIDGFIRAGVYSKQADSHIYLPPTSTHSKHVFKATPFGVALRLRRNCSDHNFLERRMSEYKNYLVSQGQYIGKNSTPKTE